MYGERLTFQDFVDRSREDIIDEWLHGYVTVEDLEHSLDSGEWIDAASEWAESQSEYVYTHAHHVLLAAGVLDDYLVEASELMDGTGMDDALQVMQRLLAIAVIRMLESAVAQSIWDAIDFLKVTQAAG